MYEIDWIKKTIPHREPFLLIDSIYELEEGERCIAVKNITENDFWVKGHFPNKPITPGSLMIEMLAQTAGVCYGKLNEKETGVLVGLDKVRFYKKVTINTLLKITAKMIRVCGKVTFFDGEISDEVDKVLTCQMIFSKEKI